MKKYWLRMGILTCLLMGLPVYAEMIENDLFPYTGVDLEWSFMRGHHEWGKLLPKSYAGSNVYAGVRLFDVAVELGYDFTFKQHCHSDFLKTRVRTDSWHADLNGFLAICPGLEALGSIGLGRTKTTISADVHAAENVFEISPINGDRKGILRAGIGIQYMFENCIGMRTLVRWKNTEKFRVRANRINQAQGLHRKPCKDTASLTFGIFTYF
jgi:hypothetical protein